MNPLIGPRIFPTVSGGKTLPCDQLLSKNQIKSDFPMFSFENSISQLPWNHGVNKWCKQQKTNRICIVSHDGTITAYRQFIEGVKLSRNDFPKETGCIKIGY